MIRILKSGLLTSIQDLGRYGYQKHGIIASGVMDSVAHRIANFLVNNASNTPTLEITLMGPVIEFQEDTLISICGGELSPMIDGEHVNMWKLIYVRKGSELRFGQPKQGFRAYLAIAGGFDVPRVMNSASTYMRAAVGGFQGRMLEKGDEIPVYPDTDLSGIFQSLSSKIRKDSFIEAPWFVAPEITSYTKTNEPIRIMRGREFELFDDASQNNFMKNTFKIDPKSDRMGYRLKGTTLSLKEKKEIVSEAVTFGTVQVPPEGNPIILLADRQTTGGYPKIGQVASVDLPRIAQMKPGENMTFRHISHAEAQHLYLKRENQLRQLKRGIHSKHH
ncbi:biotin-dependent carboxyltransferase family protein [Halobacillus sp. H74]|uniref:5-oxoprolinase subunit C family protein n=1 Tax=Halobacillus sp. H74 TaxID=3457436 RepID=UPI003FCD3AC0